MRNGCAPAYQKSGSYAADVSSYEPSDDVEQKPLKQRRNFRLLRRLFSWRRSSMARRARKTFKLKPTHARPTDSLIGLRLREKSSSRGGVNSVIFVSLQTIMTCTSTKATIASTSSSEDIYCYDFIDDEAQKPIREPDISPHAGVSKRKDVCGTKCVRFQHDDQG